MILLVDNYDSFVYNLYQFLGELGAETRVFRNDRITTEKIEEMSPTHIVLSPGPCGPEDAGISVEVARYFAGKLPVLGVCLGHQAIGQAFGGKVYETRHPVHGKASKVYHGETGVFNGLSSPFFAARYHSLAVKAKGLPKELKVTAHTDDGCIMGLSHRRYTVEGVQFHPESILTGGGKKLLANFLSMTGGVRIEPAADQAG
ncbi:MAG: aminodeoxychorismate/anthranilate synthase component II [Clostridiales bacterium]|nr:aminodeoxychorismate/anthranilate synthase component II [Clostridiales bacterium]MCF8023222.1 aminodeoxychorismate/anthranilate synthase component II [Clostridiales bacterium]